MNLREKLSENPARVGLIVGALLLACISLVLFQGGGFSRGGSAGTRAFFSVDDGKTWFADNAQRIPPFDKDGKQAVLAHVYRAAGGTKFVNHLERFTPDAKRALEEANKPDLNRKGPGDASAIQAAYLGGREVKRPGDAKWISSANVREASQVMAIKAPDGRADAVPVEP